MLGVDISERSIKVVRLSNSKRHKLLARAWCEIPAEAIQHGVITEPDVVGKALRQTIEKCGVRSTHQDVVVASIPESESFLSVVEIPAMDEQEVSEAVQWEVAQHMPFGLENVYLDWQWVSPKGSVKKDRQEVLVGAAEKKVVDPLVGLLNRLGYDVAALELESQAIVRALISEDLLDKQGLLMVDLGATVTNVVVHDRGAIRFSATLKRGVQAAMANLNPEEEGLVKDPSAKTSEQISAQLEEKLRFPLEEIVAEVHGILEYYTGLSTEHRVNEILLTGGGANLPGLDRIFQRFFSDVHLSRANPWINIRSAQQNAAPLMSLSESVHYSTALGLALRDVVF